VPRLSFSLSDTAWSPVARVTALLLIGLVAVGLGGVTTAGTSHSAVQTVDAASANLVGVHAAPPPATHPAAKQHTSHRHSSSKHSHHKAAPAKRWTPTGTGMWTYVWTSTARGDAKAIIHKAQLAGLHTIYQRYDNGRTIYRRQLELLLNAARGTGVHVVAWDFPPAGVSGAGQCARCADLGRRAGHRDEC